MPFTYKDLEELADVPYHTLRQWKSFGFLSDSDGAGTKNDPVTFNAMMVTVIMWLSRLQRFNVELRQAFDMLTEAARDVHTDVLVLRRPSCLFRRVHPSLHRDRGREGGRKKMRNKIGFPTGAVVEQMSLVH